MTQLLASFSHEEPDFLLKSLHVKAFELRAALDYNGLKLYNHHVWHLGL